MITVNFNRMKSDMGEELFEAEYRGLSSDTKPTENVQENSLFLELDTGDFYYFADGDWSKVGGA